MKTKQFGIFLLLYLAKSFTSILVKEEQKRKLSCKEMKYLVFILFKQKKLEKNSFVLST